LSYASRTKSWCSNLNKWGQLTRRCDTITLSYQHGNQIKCRHRTICSHFLLIVSSQYKILKKVRLKRLTSWYCKSNLLRTTKSKLSRTSCKTKMFSYFYTKNCSPKLQRVSPEFFLIKVYKHLTQLHLNRQ